jgi:hypothetical protein
MKDFFLGLYAKIIMFYFYVKAGVLDFLDQYKYGRYIALGILVAIVLLLLLLIF